MTTRTLENIGFIGFGIMGKPMALNLIKAGWPLWGYARRAASLQPLLPAGARACASPREVAEHADIVFTMVADTPDVEQVIVGEAGLIHGLRPGSVVVDMSTVSASATRRIAATLADRGVEMLDAPVSGGETGAIQGTLSFMVGGKDSAFQRVLPLFQAMGKNIVHIGGNGAGQIAKSCNQILVAQTIAGVAEALLFAQAAGADPAKVRQALLGGFAYSKILEVHGQRMLDHQFEPGFKAGLHQKDMRIVQEIAAELKLPLPGTALASQWINAVVANGQGELDSSALLTVLEQMAGIKIGERQG
jgi:2-hydroxy-3-oxopropionate reductase